MVGVVIVAHLDIAEQLLRTAEMITSSPLDSFRSVSINPQDEPLHASEKVLAAVKSVDRGGGVILLVDMFGGTPSNLSLSLLTKGKTEIITGVNLPMVIEAAAKSHSLSLSELVECLTQCGKREIRSASEILARKLTEDA